MRRSFFAHHSSNARYDEIAETTIYLFILIPSGRENVSQPKREYNVEKVFDTQIFNQKGTHDLFPPKNVEYCSYGSATFITFSLSF